MGGLRNLWTRYMTWRSTPGKRPPEPPRPILKIDASEGAVASAITSNYGSGAESGV